MLTRVASRALISCKYSRAVAAEMHVVFFAVAGYAIGAQSEAVCHRCGMAGLTADLHVRAVEFEAAFLIMVELCAFPAARIVAVRAARAQTLLVIIVPGVAACAFRCEHDFFRNRRIVAGLAGGTRVGVVQFEMAALIVIEAGLLP